MDTTTVTAKNANAGYHESTQAQSAAHGAKDSSNPTNPGISVIPTTGWLGQAPNTSTATVLPAQHTATHGDTQNPLKQPQLGTHAPGNT